MSGTYNIGTSLVHNGGYSLPTITISTPITGYTSNITTNYSNYSAITNTGAIYTGGAVPPGVSMHSSQLITGICVAGNNGILLNIHPDGRVEWTGPLSKNADAFVKAVEYAIDKKMASEQSMARRYRKAIERCLQQIKTMSKEDFIAVLEKEVETRTSKAVWQELSKNDEAADGQL
jgi:hypothetical protein